MKSNLFRGFLCLLNFPKVSKKSYLAVQYLNSQFLPKATLCLQLELSYFLYDFFSFFMFHLCRLYVVISYVQALNSYFNRYLYWQSFLQNCTLSQAVFAEAGSLNKCSCLARALGVTNLQIWEIWFWSHLVVLKSDLDVQQTHLSLKFPSLECYNTKSMCRSVALLIRMKPAIKTKCNASQHDYTWYCNNLLNETWHNMLNYSHLADSTLFSNVIM